MGRFEIDGDEAFAAHGAGPDVRHVWHTLRFGPRLGMPPVGRANAAVGGDDGGLAGLRTPPGGPVSGQQRFRLRVVPTVYEPAYGFARHGFRYAADTEAFVGESVALAPEADRQRGLGVWLSYDFLAVEVRHRDAAPGLVEAITSGCAVVGGVATATGLLVGCLRGLRRRQK
ncbi:unnamed protein product [Phaeothamnion confervicola]